MLLLRDAGFLANKIINGGSGVWGEHAMNAHPQLSKEEAAEMVKYVLMVSSRKKKALPSEGVVDTKGTCGRRGNKGVILIPYR